MQCAPDDNKKKREKSEEILRYGYRSDASRMKRKLNTGERLSIYTRSRNS